MSSARETRPAERNGRIAHATPVERAARGKAARAAVPRSSHSEWAPASDRPDPLALLEEQAKTRVPELVPIRYGRMLESAFTFYRGAAFLMASDLAAAERTGLEVQLCGDAHLSNFGVFAAPDRRLVFGLNDFDETLPGPFEWDLKRLVASFAVAGRDRGFDVKQRRVVLLAVTRAYREAMREFASMRMLDLWYARLDVEEAMRRWSAAVSTTALRRAERTLAKARAKDSLRAFDKLTEVVDGERRFVSDPPIITRVEELAGEREAQLLDEQIHELIRTYRETLSGDRRRLVERYRYAHAARKVVGVGSVGTRAWVVLMLARDQDDPLILQAKEAEASVLEPFLGTSEYTNHGQRVVEGQRMTQAASDIMLGWLNVSGLQDGVSRDFYVRQLWDQKGSALIETMNPRTLSVYAEVCGWSLAKAHARSGDAIALASYTGSGDVLDRALAAFAETYADQNDRDYARLKKAGDQGEIRVESGV